MAAHTLNTAATADAFAEHIDNLFSQITWGMANQAALIGMADARCRVGCNDLNDIGALVYSLEATKDGVYELVNCKLQDTVTLLLERVKELEASHV